MTDIEKNHAIELRNSGYTYSEIADEIGTKASTIKMFFHRQRQNSSADINPEPVAPSATSSGERPTRHRKRNNMTEHICSCCGKVFYAYPDKSRKYCSKSCYISDRFGKDKEDKVCGSTAQEGTEITVQKVKKTESRVPIKPKISTVHMITDQFDRELKYQITMYFCRKMLENGIISTEDYLKINNEKREDLHPVTGDLLSCRFLIDRDVAG